MNNKLLASEAQVNLNGYELNHLSPIIVANGATNSSSSNSTPKSSNRNGMLFDAVPTNYGNDNRKSSQPYYVSYLLLTKIEFIKDKFRLQY